MPNCYTLTKKGETEPCCRLKIDEELCTLLGEVPDPKYWVAGWDFNIGFALACGKTFPEIRERVKEDERLLKIVNHLERNYTPNAWYVR